MKDYIKPDFDIINYIDRECLSGSAEINGEDNIIINDPQWFDDLI